MQDSVIRYVKATVSSLVVFVLLSAYLYFRRGFFDLYIANKVLAGTSLIILAIVLLIGSLGRLYNVFDSWLTYRKHLGITSFIFAFFHGLVSLFFLPDRFNLSYFMKNFVTFFLGLAGLFILGYLFLISFKTFISKMNQKNWWIFQVWGSRIAGIMVFLHLILMKYPGWLKWYQQGGSNELARPYMPPASIIAALVGFLVILARAFELMNHKLAKIIIPVLFIGLIFFIVFSFSVGLSKI